MKTGIIWAVTALLLAGCSSEPYDPSNPAEAEVQCEDFVDKRLKAPATADYDLTAAPSSGSQWIVTGTVDSENSFGAKVRGDVRCVIRFEGDMAHLDEITIN